MDPIKPYGHLVLVAINIVLLCIISGLKLGLVNGVLNGVLGGVTYAYYEKWYKDTWMV